MAPKRRTLLPWMGGKSRLAETIITHFPEHTCYAEPFCGGCAVFFRKPRCKSEVINDRDSRLVNLLRVFRYHPDELLREMTYLTHSRQEFDDALAQPGLTDIQKAARFLFLLRTAFACKVIAPHFGYSLTSRSAFTMAGVTVLIQAARERLDGVTIENRNFEDVIRRYDSPGTLFYCDPPYIDTQRYSEGFGHDDHRRLAAALASIKGKAVISINDHPLARELYRKWHIERVQTNYSFGSAVRFEPVQELVLKNFWKSSPVSEQR